MSCKNGIFLKDNCFDSWVFLYAMLLQSYWYTNFNYLVLISVCDMVCFDGDKNSTMVEKCSINILISEFIKNIVGA